MRKRCFGFAAAAAMICAAGSAAADGMAPYARVPYIPTFGWTGCYVGAGGGYGMYNLDTHLTTAGVPITVPLDQGGRGWFGTAQVGCDYQFSGKWLAGAFIDGDLADITGKHTGQSAGAIGLVSADMPLSRSWAAGGRLGYLVNPSLLTFTSAGFTQATFDGLSYTGFGGGLTGSSIPGQTYNGYFIGGGTEYALSFHPGLFWKTEYRFADYGTKNLAVFTTATGVPTGVLETTHPYVQTIRTELVWRF
jgi:outer membrane immunogenic protein